MTFLFLLALCTSGGVYITTILTEQGGPSESVEAVVIFNSSSVIATILFIIHGPLVYYISPRWSLRDMKTTQIRDEKKSENRPGVQGAFTLTKGAFFISEKFKRQT